MWVSYLSGMFVLLTAYSDGASFPGLTIYPLPTFPLTQMGSDWSAPIGGALSGVTYGQPKRRRLDLGCRNTGNWTEKSRKIGNKIAANNENYCQKYPQTNYPGLRNKPRATNSVYGFVRKFTHQQSGAKHGEQKNTGRSIFKGNSDTTRFASGKLMPHSRTIMLGNTANTKLADKIGRGEKQVENLSKELDTQKVDAVLDELRPHLVADGGNCKLVRIDEQNRVYIELQGACKGCPSSAITVKLGIEKKLQEVYPVVRSVEAVGEGEEERLEVDSVEKALSSLRPFLRVCGGEIKVISLSVPNEGVASTLGLEISSKKSNPIPLTVKNEIVTRIKRKFPTLKDVILYDIYI